MNGSEDLRRSEVDLERACAALQPPNARLRDAVEARQEIDLRPLIRF